MTPHSTAFLSITFKAFSTLFTVFGDFADKSDLILCTSVLVISSKEAFFVTQRLRAQGADR